MCTAITIPITRKTQSMHSVHPDSFPTDIMEPKANEGGLTLLDSPINIELFEGHTRSGRGGRRFKSCHSDQSASDLLSPGFNPLDARWAHETPWTRARWCAWSRHSPMALPARGSCVP